MTMETAKLWRKYALTASFFVLAVLSMVLSPALLGQTASSGAIKGAVTDPSGAVVPNATVNATNNDTSVTRTATTGPDGSYIITLLPPGTYKLRLEVAGFKPEEVPSVTVDVTETAVLNATLEVGSKTQEVTV